MNTDGDRSDLGLHQDLPGDRYLNSHSTEVTRDSRQRSRDRLQVVKLVVLVSTKKCLVQNNENSFRAFPSQLR